MKYECPDCRSTESPKIISFFTPRIYQCLECGKKGSENDFFKKEVPKFSTPPLPPPPR